MDEPAQGKVGADRIEQRERTRLAFLALKQPIRNFVADGREARRREMAPELTCRDIGAGNLLRTLDHVRVGDLLPADTYLDFGAVLGHKRLKLLKEVAPESGRMRYRRLVDTRTLQPGESA